MVVLGHIDELHEALGEHEEEAGDGGVEPPGGGSIIAPVPVPGEGFECEEEGDATGYGGSVG